MLIFNSKDQQRTLQFHQIITISLYHRIYQKHDKIDSKTSILNFSYMLMNNNIRWDKYMLERGESKESFFCLKKQTQQRKKMELNTSFAWLLQTKLFFFPHFLFIIIFLNSKHGYYLKPFYSNLFHFNLEFSFLSN